MRCVKCGSEQLFGLVQATIRCPMAARGGEVKIGGVKFTQIDIKHAWDKNPWGTPRTERGPIVCESCDATHVFRVESKELVLASG